VAEMKRLTARVPFVRGRAMASKYHKAGARSAVYMCYM
jgi:hypothetical protein